MPGRVLFLCERNAVRSPMASALLPGSTSVGISADPYVDPFAAAVMLERGYDISGHEPRAVTPEDLKGADTVIALSRDAFEAAQGWRPDHDFTLEYWELPAIPSHDAPRDMILAGYRNIRKALIEHIANRAL